MYGITPAAGRREEGGRVRRRASREERGGRASREERGGPAGRREEGGPAGSSTSYAVTGYGCYGDPPPPAMVALMSESSSSSPLMASCKWRGVILFTLRSFEQLPANSST